MTTPLSLKAVATMAEALAAALDMAERAVPGGREQTDAIAQAKDLYLRLGVYLLDPEERKGFPAADLTHKE